MTVLVVMADVIREKLHLRRGQVLRLQAHVAANLRAMIPPGTVADVTPTPIADGIARGLGAVDTGYRHARFGVIPCPACATLSGPRLVACPACGDRRRVVVA